jgi:selenium metabolism protein YedF
MSRTLLFTQEFLGKGNDELGSRLMGSFLRTLLNASQKPDKLVFYNSAVKLVADESPVRDVLNDLNKAGIRLVACGTCVSFYGLDGKIAAERVSNMQEIVSILTESDIVVTV